MVLDKVPQSLPRAWKLGTGKSYRVVNVVLVLKIMVLDMRLTKGSDIMYHTNTIAYDIKHIGHSYLVRPPASHDEMISYSFKWYHVAVPSWHLIVLALRCVLKKKRGSLSSLCCSYSSYTSNPGNDSAALARGVVLHSERLTPSFRKLLLHASLVPLVCVRRPTSWDETPFILFVLHTWATKSIKQAGSRLRSTNGYRRVRASKRSGFDPCFCGSRPGSWTLRDTNQRYQGCVKQMH